MSQRCGPVPALRILMSCAGFAKLSAQVRDVLAGCPYEILDSANIEPGYGFEVAFLSRDVTAASTKHEVLPSTQRFHDLLRAATPLRWVHTHSAGADRPVFVELLRRGVTVTTSSGANAEVVAQTAVAGVLALARHLPQAMAAQRERRWAPFGAGGLPRELSGQTAVVVGWGPVGRRIAAILSAIGLRCIAVRQSAASDSDGFETVGFDNFANVLPRADWLLLACPLTERTRGLVAAPALAQLPAGAHLVNVARGEVVVQDDLISALRSGRLAGAYLDVFEHEPLPSTSPVWHMPNVIVTPHMAGHSDGNEARVAAMFLENLKRWRDGAALHNRAGG